MKLNQRISVLYAEDNEDSGCMLSVLLGFSDIDVLLARSIKEAFRQAQNRHFDLYLLDGKFSDGNGFDLCRRALAMENCPRASDCSRFPLGGVLLEGDLAQVRLVHPVDRREIHV